MLYIEPKDGQTQETEKQEEKAEEKTEEQDKQEETVEQKEQQKEEDQQVEKPEEEAGEKQAEEQAEASTQEKSEENKAPKIEVKEGGTITDNDQEPDGTTMETEGDSAEVKKVDEGSSEHAREGDIEEGIDTDITGCIDQLILNAFPNMPMFFTCL